MFLSKCRLALERWNDRLSIHGCFSREGNVAYIIISRYVRYGTSHGTCSAHLLLQRVENASALYYYTRISNHEYKTGWA